MQSGKDIESLVSLPSSGEEESEGEAELTSDESESDWSSVLSKLFMGGAVPPY